MSFNQIGNSSLIAIPGKITTGDKVGLLFYFLTSSSFKGVGILTGHNHESRFQSSDYLNELRKDPNIDSQPKPILEIDSMNSLVTISDQEQTLTIYDLDTQKVPFVNSVMDNHVPCLSRSNLMYGIAIGVQDFFLSRVKLSGQSLPWRIV